MFKVSGRTRDGFPLKTYFTDSRADALNAREKYGPRVQIDSVPSPDGLFTITGRSREGYPIGKHYYDSYAEALNRQEDLGKRARIERVIEP